MKIKIPKRRNYNSYTLAISISIYLMSFDSARMDKLWFGVILLSLVFFLHHKIFHNHKEKTFEVETHYDKLASVLSILFGLGFIAMSVNNSDFFKILRLAWINYLIIGGLLIYNGLEKRKSLVFRLKSDKLINIDDYDLSIKLRNQGDIDITKPNDTGK